MGASVIPLGYQPRAAFAPFHSRRQRWSSLVCHRRAGKTVACVADLVDAALRLKKPNPRFAYIAPYFSQAKDVAWVYLKDMTDRGRKASTGKRTDGRNGRAMGHGEMSRPIQNSGPRSGWPARRWPGSSASPCHMHGTADQG